MLCYFVFVFIHICFLLWSRINTSNRIEDPHPFNGDSDPDPAIYFNADPDPAPRQSDGICDQWSVDPVGHFESPCPHFKPLKFLNFNLNGDPDPTFHSNVDPDPVSQNNADHCKSGVRLLSNTYVIL